MKKFGKYLWQVYPKNMVSHMPDVWQRSRRPKFLFLPLDIGPNSTSENLWNGRLSLGMGMLSLNQHHPDYLKLRVLVTLFGGYFGSRLMGNIREQKGYTYGITAGLLPYPGEGVLTISSDTAPEYVQPLVQEVYKEMDRLCNERVSDEELERVRSYMLGEMCRSYESVFSLSDAWIFIRISGLDKSYFTDIPRAIETVTPDELRDLAQKYLCKENLKMVVCGKKFS